MDVQLTPATYPNECQVSDTMDVQLTPTTYPDECQVSDATASDHTVAWAQTLYK